MQAIAAVRMGESFLPRTLPSPVGQRSGLRGVRAVYAARPVIARTIRLTGNGNNTELWLAGVRRRQPLIARTATFVGFWNSMPG